MNVTIIYGTTRKSSTYNYVQLLLNSLSLNINIKVTEFLLPKDLPSFNRECFSPLTNSLYKRTHVNYIDSIVASINECDLIILASPVLTCDISTEMESFLKHISYHYIQNESNYSMNNKIGLVMSTTTGVVGSSNNIKTLKRNLKFLGINNIFKFAETIYEINLKNITLKRNLQLNKRIFKLSYSILNLYINSCHIKNISLRELTSLENITTSKEHHCNVIDLMDLKNHT